MCEQTDREKKLMIRINDLTFNNNSKPVQYRHQYRTDRSYVSNKSIPGTRVLEMDPRVPGRMGPKTSTRGTRDTTSCDHQKWKLLILR